jgi:GIY-YIG catalytic domain
MADNALVTWVALDRPWLVEGQLITLLNAPLNLDQNRQHPFHQQLSNLRRDARARARGAKSDQPFVAPAHDPL